ncbi:MAG: GAF domain-containing protein [Burkholderiales bacterium]|nr:GAF domain-containing protein [Anaerolineae bacterium]
MNTAAKHTQRILIVDSLYERRHRLVTQVFPSNAYAIIEADTLSAAVALSSTCDLMLAYHQPLDVMMLHGALHNANINKPIILLTEAGSERLAVRAFRIGIKDYLSAPFTGDDVLTAVHDALDQHLVGEIIARIPEQLLSSNLELTAYLRGLDSLVEISKSITADLNLEEVLSQVVDAAVSVTRADTAAIMLVDAVDQELYVRASRNWDAEMARNLRLPIHNSAAGRVVDTGEPIFMNDDTPRKIKTDYLVKSVAYIPLRIGEQIIGVLSVDNRVSNRLFNSHEMKLLTLLADFASVALGNASQYFQIQQERNMLDAILEGTQNPVMVVDTSGNILVCNPAAQRIFAIPGNYNGPAVEVIEHEGVLHLLDAERTQRSEIAISETHVFNAQMTVIPQVGRAIIMQDISHLKELDRLKTNFVANVSQDLRSPLTAIMGYAELLTGAGSITPQQKKFIDRITLSAQSISSLITDLLDLSRIETAEMEVTQEVVHIQAIAEYALATVEGQISAKQQRLIVGLDNDALPIFGNGQRLKQMVRNLMQNAIQFTPEEGIITVTLRCEDDFIVLEVQDTGIGIASQDQPHIFDKFFRAESVRQQFEGAGLGLAIVKSIVDLHEGRVWVESEVGIGSTFTVLLPTCGMSSHSKEVRGLTEADSILS